MDLEIIKHLNVDFNDAKYISINAKQYDRFSRFILVTCYDNGVVFPLNIDNNYAYIRYRKPDSLGVFNSCEITNEGKILIELSEQMLSTIGKSRADLVIVHNESTGDIDIDENTGELIIENDCNILSTMHFYINVIESSFDNTEIESSYEYNALNELLIKATNDYTNIIDIVRVSEKNAKESENKASISEANAKLSETNAKTSEENASISELNAKESENMAATKAEESFQFASNSAQSAIESADSAMYSADKATESLEHATLSKSYAIGGTNARENEDSDNAQFYYSQTKAISDSIDGSFIPVGTIDFAQLQFVAKEVGYVYHIRDGFVTDDTFKEGAGVSYPSGTNVYYTLDGYWDCFIAKELTGDLTVADDDMGNVTIVFTHDDTNISYDDYNVLNQTIAALQERIKMLEEQTVLGITE